MEWFPVVYHLVDKVALVVFTVLGYYTGKYHLSDTIYVKLESDAIDHWVV